MKFPTTTTTALLCATTLAHAAPLTEQRRAHAAQRALGSRPLIPADGIIDVAGNNNNNNTHVQYSSNWAGAVLIGNGYTSVAGTIVVPTPKAGAGTGGRASSASAWVGIDGDTCSTSILQTGIDFTYTNGQVSYDAWYEWFPDYAYNFNGITIKAGDTVTMTVTASSKTGGTAVIENESTGQTATHTFAAQSAALCETNAEWIVEDFESGGSLVPFADFGTVTFTGASARSGGGTVGVNGATIIDIQQGSKVFTDCGTSGSSSVYCRYIG